MTTPGDRRETPALRQLMSAYFHEDFYSAYGGAWETLAVFADDAPEAFASLGPEIEYVLQRLEDDSAVEDYVVGLGCEYLPPPGTGGYRAWLEEIAQRVRTATGRT